MTLVVAAIGRESIWMVADRRVSSPARRKDDARKMMFLETKDGVAILGYAGLGATHLGTEPADWMSAVLRGRNLPLEKSLDALAGAVKRQLPQHLLGLGRQAAHCVIIPSFVGETPSLYSIELVLSGDGTGHDFKYSRQAMRLLPDGEPCPPRVACGGSGCAYLMRDRKWVRELLRLVSAYDRKRISTRPVAVYLSGLNHRVHFGTADQSVGPRCVVGWRHRRGGIYKGGGGQLFFSGTNTDAQVASMPAIASGMDVTALVETMTPHMLGVIERMQAGELAAEMDRDAVDADLARLPDKPDEDLR